MKPNQSKESRLIGHGLLLTCFLVLCPFSARASLQFDVFPGYDAVVPNGSWFPVVCEVYNSGPTFDAVFEISSAQFGQAQTIRVPVELPTATRKRMVVPMYQGSGMVSWDFRLLDERGRVRAEHAGVRPRRQIGWEIPLVGALARTAAGMPVMPQAKVRQAELQPQVARLLPAVFPDHAIALEGLDVIYLNSQRALELTSAQAHALLLWLHQGGHLVVGVEEVSEISGNAWLRDLLPCELFSTGIVRPHDSFADWLRRETALDALEASHVTVHDPYASPQRTRPPQPATPVLQPRESTLELSSDSRFETAEMVVALGEVTDGRVRVAAGNVPLVIEADRGYGRVTVLTFSPEREPFLSWENRPWFWARMAGIPDSLFTVDERAGRYGAMSLDGVFGAMIDSRQVRKLPLGWLLLLLTGYLVVIGPLDYWWLKKTNRQMLTWVTFPCYVVLFSGLIYLIGYKLRAGESEWNELHVVDVITAEGRPLMRGRTYSSIYSPSNARYPVSSSQPFAAVRGEFTGTWGGGNVSGRLNVVQRGNAFDADVFVPVWTSQLFVTDWVQPGAIPMSLEVRKADGNFWMITARNFLPRNLPHVHVVIGDRIFNIGQLAARETRTVALEPIRDGTLLSEYVGGSAGALYRAAESRRQAFGDAAAAQLADPVAGAIAASFSWYLNVREQSHRKFISTDRFDLSAFTARENTAILLAWDEGHSPIQNVNQFTPRRGKRDTLLRMVVSVEDNEF